MLHYFKDTWIEWLWLPNIHAETLISKRNWIYIIKEWSRRPFSPPTISGYFRKTACESRMLALYRQSTFIWTLGFTASRTGPWSIVSLNSTIKEQYKRCSYLYRQACIMRHRTLKPVSNYTIQGLTLFFRKITKMRAKQILMSKDRRMQSYKVSFLSL